MLFFKTKMVFDQCSYFACALSKSLKFIFPLLRVNDVILNCLDLVVIGQAVSMLLLFAPLIRETKR